MFSYPRGSFSNTKSRITRKLSFLIRIVLLADYQFILGGEVTRENKGENFSKNEALACCSRTLLRSTPYGS